jgi:bifunctional non-homologous end joining protein LigD
VNVTHADKVFYPDDGLTKGDVVEHYRTVAEVMVPHLRGRPLTLRRYPDGIGGEGWFQKHASDHLPGWIRTEEVPQRAGGTVRHVICDDARTLEYLADQGTLEFHVWLSTVDAPERPDRLVLDIDPPGGVGVTELRSVARRIRDRYEEIGLTAYVQATGGRGFHVVAPLDARSGTDVVLALSREIADSVAADDSEHLTTAQRKEKRGGRIFLDANRNGYAQTFVAPYSLRARPGAGVATPLDWSELGRSEPDGWNPAKIRRRLTRKQDPWHVLGDTTGSADTALEKLRDR